MKKLLLVFCFLFLASSTVNAGIYLDNMNRFQIVTPENWRLSGRDQTIDHDAIFEIHQDNASHNDRTLIGIKTTVAKENRQDFSFANMTDAEKSRLHDQTYQKFSANLPEHSSIDSHQFLDYGTNTFLVTTISHQKEGQVYKAITAITYFADRQYTFYLFANSNNNQAKEEFSQMLASFQILK